jgi:hypothetical protein
MRWPSHKRVPGVAPERVQHPKAPQPTSVTQRRSARRYRTHRRPATTYRTHRPCRWRPLPLALLSSSGNRASRPRPLSSCRDDAWRDRSGDGRGVRAVARRVSASPRMRSRAESRSCFPVGTRLSAQRSPAPLGARKARLARTDRSRPAALRTRRSERWPRSLVRCRGAHPAGLPAPPGPVAARQPLDALALTERPPLMRRAVRIPCEGGDAGN